MRVATGIPMNLEDIETVIAKAKLSPQQASILRLLAAEGQWMSSVKLSEVVASASLRAFHVQIFRLRNKLRRHGYVVENQNSYRVRKK